MRQKYDILKTFGTDEDKMAMLKELDGKPFIIAWPPDSGGMAVVSNLAHPQELPAFLVEVLAHVVQPGGAEVLANATEVKPGETQEVIAAKLK